MKVENGITIVNGEKVRVSLPRIGTRCKLCGEPIDGNHAFVKASVPNCPIVYAHKDCIRTRAYHEGFFSPSGVERPLFGDSKETKDGILITPEIEVASVNFDWESETERTAFLVQFQLWAERDCTVFREFHPFTVLNLHGAKERYRNLEKMVDMKADCCGHHINASWIGFSFSDYMKLNDNAPELFEPVMDAMEQDREATIKVFGRYFGRWAKFDYCFVHGSWLNLDNDNRIEVRLFHYANPTQIVWGMLMVKEWCKVLRRFCSGEIDAQHAAKLIKNWFIKTANETATYCRKEQNSKI